MNATSCAVCKGDAEVTPEPCGVGWHVRCQVCYADIDGADADRRLAHGMTVETAIKAWNDDVNVCQECSGQGGGEADRSRGGADHYTVWVDCERCKPGGADVYEEDERSWW